MLYYEAKGVRSVYMSLEERKVFYDKNLKIEAYLFKGIMQKFPNHFHEYYVIGFIESGRRHLSCKNKEYNVNPGDLLLFNPMDNHTCEQIDEEALDYRCINIKKEVMQTLVNEITGKYYLPEFAQPVIIQSEIVFLLRELHRMIMEESADFGKEEALYFLIEQLLDFCPEPVYSDIKEVCVVIKKACDYMEENFIDHITLDDLSNVSGLNKYTLLRNFTRQRGLTPYQYLETIRVNHAKRLLEQGIEPIEAAGQTGFTDQSHFTRYFKNFIGLTPKQYQNIFVKDK